MAHFPGMAFMRDRKGRFVFVNPVMAGILGKPAVEIVGRQALGLLPPEVAEDSLEGDRAILESGQSLSRPMRDPPPQRHPPLDAQKFP